MTARSNKTNQVSGDRAQAGPGTAADLLRSLDRFGSGGISTADLAGLAEIQSSMMRNYFRLLRAQEELERRARRVHVAPGAAILDQLEAERSRLAHELHAGAGQALAGIKIHLELIDSALAEPPEQVRASLHRIGLLAQEALRQLRSIARRIHPPDWERLSLAEALESLWDVTGIPQKFQAELKLAALPVEPDHYTRVLLYRTAQEALANVIRHSGATRVRLSLAACGASLELSVEDNGNGFDAAAVLDGAGPASGGIGLRSMREQVRWAGGDISVESGPGGTRLTVRAPASESA